jgi:YbbR domain-containing protein
MSDQLKRLAAPFRQNGTLKGLALVIAVTLVVLKRDGKIHEHDIVVPLKISVTEPDKVPVGVPDSVVVTLSGTDPSIKRIQVEDLEPFVRELSGNKDQIIRIDRRQLRRKGAKKGLPMEWVKRIEPDKIWVKFEQIIVKSVPVRIRMKGEVQSGYELLGSQTEPTKVDVEGPRSIVSRMPDILTQPVNLDGLNRTETRDWALESPPHRVTLKPPGRMVSIRLEIEEKSETRVLTDLDIALLSGDSTDLLTSVPSAVTVLVEGPRTQILALDRKSVDVYINPDSVPLGAQERMEIVVDAPEGVEVRQVTPTHALVSRKKKPKSMPIDAGLDDDSVDDGNTIRDAGLE